jgi:hypothetical protein
VQILRTADVGVDDFVASELAVSYRMDPMIVVEAWKDRSIGCSR